jgi:allophanate hydrolase
VNLTKDFKMAITINEIRTKYLSGNLTPEQLMESIREKSKMYEDRNIWIHILSAKEQKKWLQELSQKPIDTHPLWGIPFAIKDNIDLAGIATTAACPDFSYVPEKSAFVVQKLIDAGAIPVGKTNLDQFATGLNGTRSPYGECHNAFNPDFISGGSSAGSSVAVALGLSAFSLGTDTAGSGRIPAGFNNLIGVKPSIGLLSATGMLPACRSLDCMTIFSLTVDDANLVLSQAEGLDTSDEYSRKNTFANSQRFYGKHQGPLKIGILPDSQLKFFGDKAYTQLYQQTIESLNNDGVDLIEIDYAAFDEAALMLYEGPWVAERYLACQPLIDENPEAIHPVVREIVKKGKYPSAADLFTYQYRLQGLKSRCRKAIEEIDCLLTPTAGKHFTIAEMLEQPVICNSQLGYYTNFMNLFDMAAVAVPTGFTETGMPFGVTISSLNFRDRSLLSIANRIEALFHTPLGALNMKRPNSLANSIADQTRVDLVVCGAHLEGLPLNWQLKERGAILKAKTQSSPDYKLFALAGGSIARPGMLRAAQGGRAIDVEVWSIPSLELGSFVAAIPEPLGIGKVQLADGSWKSGFICDGNGLADATDITDFCSWKAWIAQN